MSRPPRLRPPAVVFLALCAALLAPSTAYGHAAFLGSQPEPGTRLETAPREIALSFTEPLNRRLSKAELVEVKTGEKVATGSETTPARRLVLRPAEPLERGAYRVQWHTVSTEDGHALEGSFSFGVQAAAAGGDHVLEQSPLARDGWLRVLARAVLYVALLLFVGALLLRVLLGRGGRSWLAPQSEESRGAGPAEAVASRERTVTADAGWLAAGAAVAVATLEAADAAGGLSLAGLRDFLLSNLAGIGRAATVVLLGGAVLVFQRRPRLAALLATTGLGAVAVSGHANSATPRLPAVVNDWMHLGAGAVWLGGIALVLLVWTPQLRAGGRAARMVLAREVLPRFGDAALPAFLLVAGTGVVSLIIQLGHVQALWETAYGRVLLVKIVLVALIAGASYTHALRLRPRLLAANPHPSGRLERRHWRLLRAEPMLGLGVVVAVAALVTFPLPPRQLGEADEAAASGPPAACDPCPLPRPRADELAVAEQAGSQLVAAWLRRSGKRVSGYVRVLDYKGRPAKTPFTVLAARQEPCGPACRRFELEGRARTLAVAVQEKGKRYVARLPARWRVSESTRARRLLRRAQRNMRRLRSVREVETVTSGPGSFARTVYRLRAPDRFAYRTNGRAETVVVGGRQWYRAPGSGWRRRSFGAGVPFRTRSWFRWTPYAQEVRLLGVERRGKRRFAELALMDPATPVWLRLRVDLDSLRVARARMITKAHYMTQRYFAFNRRVTIEPPG